MAPRPFSPVYVQVKHSPISNLPKKKKKRSKKKGGLVGGVGGKNQTIHVLHELEARLCFSGRCYSSHLHWEFCNLCSFLLLGTEGGLSLIHI